MDVVWLLLTSIIGGYLVAFVTGLLLGTEKVSRYPGGSLAMGLMTGFNSQLGMGWTVAAAICGVIGWWLCVISIDSLTQALSRWLSGVKRKNEEELKHKNDGQ